VPGVVDDELVTVAVDGTAYADRKTAAMRAHHTQIAVDGPFFALSNDLGQPFFAVEYYRLAHGEAPAGPLPAGDLFAGPGHGRGGRPVSRPVPSARPQVAYRTMGSNPLMTPGARVACYVGLGILGAVVALAGGLIQGGWLPGGVLLALAGCVALFFGGTRLTGTRLGTVVPAAVWLLSVILLSTSRPEGDFLFAAGVGPYVYLLGGAFAAVICATLPQPLPRSPSTDKTRSPSTDKKST
jgi:hypothetical protein